MQPFGVLDRYMGETIFTTIMMTLCPCLACKPGHYQVCE